MSSESLFLKVRVLIILVLGPLGRLTQEKAPAEGTLSSNDAERSSVVHTSFKGAWCDFASVAQRIHQQRHSDENTHLDSWSMNAYIRACVYIYIYMYIVHTHINTCTSTHSTMCVHIYMGTLYMCTLICTYVYVDEDVDVH